MFNQQIHHSRKKSTHEGACDTCCTGVALIATGVTFLAGALRALVLRVTVLEAAAAVGIREKRVDSFIITTRGTLVSIFVTL